jgi:hypothetical protein
MVDAKGNTLFVYINGYMEITNANGTYRVVINKAGQVVELDGKGKPQVFGTITAAQRKTLDEALKDVPKDEEGTIGGGTSLAKPPPPKGEAASAGGGAAAIFTGDTPASFSGGAEEG